MSSSTAPLLHRKAEDTIAVILSNSLVDDFPDDGGESAASRYISVAQFVQQVLALAERLPAGEHVVNLCGNRYLFMLAFCAAVVRRQCNLLPPNKNTSTQRTLAARYDQVYVLHDGIEVDTSIPGYHIGTLVSFEDVSDSCIAIPEIPLDQLAAITFTSGSTGESKPNAKPWRTFYNSSLINRRYMVPSSDQTIFQLATVPGQHMWGMETSVLLPLFSNLAMCDLKPLYPSDIQASLEALPSPRMLVSTPVHLRALAMSGLAFPEVMQTLCATAPLASALAAETEQLFDGELREIYGCSEVGSMAHRNTSQTESWSLFEGLAFVDSGTYSGDTALLKIVADHLPESVIVSDHIQRGEGRSFSLLGRSSDMVEIAGKRGSLKEVNAILLSLPGVVDGAIFLPEQTRMVPRLAALVVVKGGLTKAMISAHFRERIDAAFVPRPIYLVECLPREENGKLLPAKLADAYRSCQRPKP